MKFVTEKSVVAAVPNSVVFRNIHNGRIRCLTCKETHVMYDLNTCRCGAKLDALFVGDTRICFKAKTVFEDNDVVYSLLGYEGGYNKDQNRRLFLRPVTFRLKFRHDGKVVIKSSTKTIRGIEMLNSIIPRFNTHFEELKDYNISDYYTANNHRLKDLLTLMPSQETYWYESTPKDMLARSVSVFFENTSPTTRARIYRNYDKYGTKGANTSLLYNKGNKALNKLAWDYLASAPQLGNLLKDHDVSADLIVHTLKDVQRNNIAGAISFLSAACSLGYSFKKSVNMMKKSPGRLYALEQSARDAAMMVHIIRKNMPEYTVDVEMDLHRLHDIISRDYNTIRANIDDKVTLPVHQYNGVASDKYTLKAAVTGGDLIRCGNQMSICVGGYTYSVLAKSCEIYIVYNDDHLPVVCIEVARCTINQAKLKANKRIVNDLELFHFVRDWADSHQLKWEECYDMQLTQNDCPRFMHEADEDDADDLPF